MISKTEMQRLGICCAIDRTQIVADSGRASLHGLRNDLIVHEFILPTECVQFIPEEVIGLYCGEHDFVTRALVLNVFRVVQGTKVRVLILSEKK